MQNIKLPSRLVGIGLYTPAEASLYTGIPAAVGFSDIPRMVFSIRGFGARNWPTWKSAY